MCRVGPIGGDNSEKSGGFMSKIERLRGISTRLISELAPSDAAWRGAAVGVFVFVALLVLAFFTIFFIQDFTWQKLPAFPARVGTLFLMSALALVALSLIARVPFIYRVALIVFTPFVLILFAPGDDQQGAIFTLATILIVSFIGAGISVFRREGFYPKGQKVTIAVLTIGVVGLLGGSFAIFSAKDSPNPLLDNYVAANLTLNLPNPGLPGEFDVLTTSYGSGLDLRREEFAGAAGFQARSVDGSKLIDNWDGFSGWLRTSYWGFDATELPLQGRVWYPAGDGPYPLVLIVHGNHSMEDFSDPGYAYVGELFASRGIILASVDENFLNSSMSARVDLLTDRPGLKEENDARGWMLLQHLAQWRDWNDEPDHQFENKVDMERVALIGHSRGGEAVAVAASFNGLDRYPDDATLDFDFDFNLRGVIAIAPVDGQYRPRGNGKPIRDVNYFTIHGSMDGDVQTFDGTAQYSRVSFSGDAYRFRSSLYIDGANHGQFNTTWENLDTSLFRAWALDLGRIMDGEAQRDVARVFFGAFMEVVLNDRYEYLPVFADFRKAAAWLPDVYYISQFSDSEERVLTDFEEDIDPSTMTVTGGRIDTSNLSRWYEVKNSLKSARRVSEHTTHAAVFAWDSKFSDQTASVRFTLPDSWSGADESEVISLSLSDAGVGTLPSDWQEPEQRNDTDHDEPADAEQPLDWTVRLTDRNGGTASLLLSHDQALYPPVNALPRRASFLDGSEPADTLYRRFELPLDDFLSVNPSLDVASLMRIEFIFDRSERGSIAIDDLSISEQQRN